MPTPSNRLNGIVPAGKSGWEVHFAAWQRTRLSEEDSACQLGYWRDVLSDVAPCELPTDRPRPRTS